MPVPFFRKARRGGHLYSASLFLNDNRFERLLPDRSRVIWKTRPCLIEQTGTLAVNFKNKFAKKGIGPGEPAAGEFTRIIAAKRFMHEPGSSVRYLKHFKTGEDFRVI